MQDISGLLNKLTLLDNRDNKNLLQINYEEICIHYIKNYNLMDEFYLHLSKFKNLISRGTLLSNKEVVLWLLKYNWIYNKIVEGILSISVNCAHDISNVGLDKFTPDYFMESFKINLSEEHFNLINQNFIYYNKIFQ